MPTLTFLPLPPTPIDDVFAPLPLINDLCLCLDDALAIIFYLLLF
jgi:hypothetical protein